MVLVVWIRKILPARRFQPIDPQQAVALNEVGVKAKPDDLEIIH
ncbi:hypothetical protein SynMEDNS5_02100 [Synechococcus sp. MEDNS5]|nr:hypothetical protein SynMEDNS5_02100 [Synechococcus sp. MEDNS5]